MALLEQWQKVAYNEKADRGELQRFWQRYFLLEKGVYEKLLTNPDEKVEGTVKELADKYGLSIMDMTGFLDGINESLVEPNPIDTMEEDTKVSLVFDKEKLYKNRQEIQILLRKVSAGSRVQGKYRYVVLPFLFHGKTALGSKKVLQARVCVSLTLFYNRKILPAVEKENRL